MAHADLLVKYGADLHAQNNAGNTPLHVAAAHGQVRGWVSSHCVASQCQIHDYSHSMRMLRKTGQDNIYNEQHKSTKVQIIN